MRKIIDNKFGGEIHVILEGLQNYPEKKKELSVIAKKIKENANNKKSHLSDIALHLNFLSKELLKISDNLFELHKKEKQNGV